jgi:hypothetical protein
MVFRSGQISKISQTWVCICILLRNYTAYQSIKCRQQIEYDFRTLGNEKSSINCAITLRLLFFPYNNVHVT